jgi:hypothetical protein
VEGIMKMWNEKQKIRRQIRGKLKKRDEEMEESCRNIRLRCSDAVCIDNVSFRLQKHFALVWYS